MASPDQADGSSGLHKEYVVFGSINWRKVLSPGLINSCIGELKRNAVSKQMLINLRLDRDALTSGNTFDGPISNLSKHLSKHCLI